MVAQVDLELETARRRIHGWVDRYAPRLYRIARANCDSDADADDLLQEVWAVLLTRWDRLPAEERVWPWLVTTTLNVARATGRVARRRAELLEENRDQLDRPGGREQPPVEIRLLIERVWVAVGDLPELQRDVFVARILGGLSTKEVARTIDRAEGTVKTSLYRALQKLREEFGDTIEQALEAVSSQRRRGTE